MPLFIPELAVKLVIERVKGVGVVSAGAPRPVEEHRAAGLTRNLTVPNSC